MKYLHMKTLSSIERKRLIKVIDTSSTAQAALRECMKNPIVEKEVVRYIQSGKKATNALYDLLYGTVFCKTCGTGTPAFISLYAGYKTYCCHRCVGDSPDVISKKKSTCSKNFGCDFPQQSGRVRSKTVNTVKSRYGVDNVSRSAAVNEARKETFRAKFGVDNPRKSEAIKSKTRKINLERWGTEFPQTLDHIKDKVRQTCLIRYGVDNVIKDPNIRRKQTETFIRNLGVDHPSKSKSVVEKRKSVCQSRYGGNSSMSSEHVRSKMRRNNQAKYGVDHAIQVPEFAEKSVRNSAKAYKHKFGRRTYMVRGYERFAFDYFAEKNISYTDVVNSAALGLPTFCYNDRLYVPDFYIKSANTVVEVKSTYTLGLKSRKVFNTVKAKARAVERDGFKFLLLVYSRDGTLLYKKRGSKLSLTSIRRKIALHPPL